VCVCVYIGKNSYHFVKRYRTEMYELSGTVLNLLYCLFWKLPP